MPQTREDKEATLKNLPAGTIRVQIVTGGGKQVYKRPEDIDFLNDEICFSGDGSPIVMRGKPGRPNKSSLPPATPQIAAVSAVREDHMGNNPITREVEKNPDGEDTFNLILGGMADEAASIEFDRLEAQRNGQDASDLATKRARILKGVAELILHRKKMSEISIDLDSVQFQNLFKFILQNFKESMEDSGMRSEQIETTFSKLVARLSDSSWKEEAKQKMKGKS